MRAPLALLLPAIVLTGCASPREKDCKALMPLVDEAKSARVLSLPDGGALEAGFAERPRRVSKALREVSPTEPAMRPFATSLADAMERFAAAMAATDQLVSALKMKPGSPPVNAFGVVDASRPHVERLLHRCGMVMRTEQQRALTDCMALERALERCVTPAADDTSAEELLLTCAAAIEAVRSDDPTANESIRNVATTVRGFEPVARNVGVPARDVIRVAKDLTPAIGKQTAAREDAERAEAAIRTMCQPGHR